MPSGDEEAEEHWLQENSSDCESSDGDDAILGEFFECKNASKIDTKISKKYKNIYLLNNYDPESDNSDIDIISNNNNINKKNKRKKKTNINNNNKKNKGKKKTNINNNNNNNNYLNINCIDSEDSEDELIKLNKLREPIVTEVAAEMNVLNDESSVFSSDFNISETGNDNNNNNNNNNINISADSDEPMGRKTKKYKSSLTSDESDNNNNNNNNNKKKYKRKKKKYSSSDSMSEGHENDGNIPNNINKNNKNKKKYIKKKKINYKNTPWSQSKLPHNGKILFRGKVGAERFKLANKNNKRNNKNNNNNNSYSGQNADQKTQQIQNIKTKNKKKRETKKKNSTKAGLGERLSFAVIFGYGWRYKYLIFFAQWARDAKSTKNPTYYIKRINKINSYYCRDILMHTIKRNRKLKTRRFSFDGASTHSSAGGVNKKTGYKSCHMVNYLTNNKIKTFGFAGENVPQRYIVYFYFILFCLFIYLFIYLLSI